MKKVLYILFVLIMISGCAKENSQLSIVVPSGAPSLAFYSEVTNPNFNTSDAQSIMTELKSEKGSDIVVIDTVNGVKAIDSGADYSLAATITFGNFYIAATGLDDNGVMDKDDYIVLFANGATPDTIFHYIYGNQYDDSIHYVASVNDALACLLKGLNIADDSHDISEEPYVDYVMIAEPALSIGLAQSDKVSVYANVQDLYKEKANVDMIQASVFVCNNLDKSVIDEYLNNLEKEINNLLTNPTLFKDVIEQAGISDDEVKDVFGVPNTKIVNKVLQNNTIGLGFKKAYDNRDSINTFLSLFGVNEVKESVYYK